MLRESSTSFHKLSHEDSLFVLKEIAVGRTLVLPIRKAVKMFVRLSSEGLFTYAREVYDLGTLIVPKHNIASRLSELSLQAEVISALEFFENGAISEWPFLPGSHSWLEIEIDANEKKVFVNRAVRLTSLGKENVEKSALSTKVMISSLRTTKPSDSWSVVAVPSSGINVDPAVIKAYEDAELSVNEVANQILKENSHAEGFYIYSDIGKIRIVASRVSEDKPSSPLPIVGIMK